MISTPPVPDPRRRRDVDRLLRSLGRIACCVVALASRRASPQASVSSPTDSALVAALPLVERPATLPGRTVVLLLTGDGGWAGADEKVAVGLRADGAAVVGVNMRAYLGSPRTPEQVASDLAMVARTYQARWHRDRLLLLGYSRGADIAPFVAARWPADLRARLDLVALISLSSFANFHFHWVDLVRDVRRDDDLPVAPELQRLRGLHVICVYGMGEGNSGCRDADSTVVTRYAREGGHRITDGFEAVRSLLEAGLTPAR
jgi:type IV secretory pathway VirJ component